MNAKEILHRAKLKGKDRWIIGYYCSKQETTYCVKEDYERHPVEIKHYMVVDSMTDWGLPNELRLYEIEEDTVCCWTGMVDKNGVKIWEKDIVSYVQSDKFGNPHRSTIVVKNMIDILIVDCCNEREIVGNIFDNPNLEVC